MQSSIPPEWMRWTIPTVIFISFIITMLTGFTIWDMNDPGWSREGTILPIETTRGDRLFMSLLLTGLTFLAWLYFVGQSAAWAVILIGFIIAVLVIRYF